MSKKENFIELVEILMTNVNIDEKYSDALEFWETFKEGKSIGGITETGQKILVFMQKNASENNNLFKAKTIGEGLFISSRSVSGSMRKLLTDGYVVKTPGNPVIYSLTESGKSLTFDN